MRTLEVSNISFGVSDTWHVSTAVCVILWIMIVKFVCFCTHVEINIVVFSLRFLHIFSLAHKRLTGLGLETSSRNRRTRHFRLCVTCVENGPIGFSYWSFVETGMESLIYWHFIMLLLKIQCIVCGRDKSICCRLNVTITRWIALLSLKNRLFSSKNNCLWVTWRVVWKFQRGKVCQSHEWRTNLPASETSELNKLLVWKSELYCVKLKWNKTCN